MPFERSRDVLLADLPIDAEFRYRGRTWVKRTQLPGECLCVSTGDPAWPQEARRIDCRTEVQPVETGCGSRVGFLALPVSGVCGTVAGATRNHGCFTRHLTPASTGKFCPSWAVLVALQ